MALCNISTTAEDVKCDIT